MLRNPRTFNTGWLRAEAWLSMMNSLPIRLYVARIGWIGLGLLVIGLFSPVHQPYGDWIAVVLMVWITAFITYGFCLNSAKSRKDLLKKMVIVCVVAAGAEFVFYGASTTDENGSDISRGWRPNFNEKAGEAVRAFLLLVCGTSTGVCLAGFVRRSGIPDQEAAKVLEALRFLSDGRNVHYGKLVEILFGDLDIASKSIIYAPTFEDVINCVEAKLEIVNDPIAFTRLLEEAHNTHSSLWYPNSPIGEHAILGNRHVIMDDVAKQQFEARHRQLRLQLDTN